VVYRDWTVNAKGDGSFFSNQAPGRLGFTRYYGVMHIVRFKTDDNIYLGSVTAGGDLTISSTFISKNPCDPASIPTNAPSGMYVAKAAQVGIDGGHFNFIVATQDQYTAMKASSNASVASWAKFNVRLEPNSYYYLHSYNAVSTVIANPNAPDDCVDPYTGQPKNNCYYLAMDFNHLLYNVYPTVGPLGTEKVGNIIPGYTH